ncbi:E3 ubiquitin-protein ligase RMA1H1-like isoform X2 [Lotus japonicus]|nr:E3 ubiquitin-protein ligase RMA1H1-like isoform X2 [Lotus japonicus]
MALDAYLEETMSQIDSFEDRPSLEKWKSSTDFIAESDRTSSGGFDCNICLDCVQDPVVTLCGHLYCWPCIYKWLNSNSASSENVEQNKPQCPVCKSEVSQSSLVPLYGRGQTTIASKNKAYQQVGSVIPRRPLGPILYNATSTASEPTFQSNQHFHDPYHRHHHHHHHQMFNSIPSSYSTSPMFSTSGSLDNTFGIFGEMMYATVFGNQVSNMYSYNQPGSSNPRIRRHLMRVDKSLSRICFFLFCCMVLCLLLF